MSKTRQTSATNQDTYDLQEISYPSSREELDEPVGGGQVGEAVIVPAMPMKEGIFQAALEFGTRNSCSALLLLALASVPAMAKDEACAGVTQKCTQDEPYEKTIGGLIYSCYDCKQTLCKDGGNGGIAGTATSSVCTEKATTFRPISRDDQSRGGDRLAPRPAASRRPGRDVDPRAANFDEADALFGKRLRASEANQPEQRDHRTASAQTTRDHRGQSNRTRSMEEIRDGTSNTTTFSEHKLSQQGLQAPSDLAIQDASATALTLSWHDNSTDEFGVELYRTDPVEGRRDPDNAWKLVETLQERRLDNVTGTGVRLHQDTGLNPDTEYCYRMRAYSGFQRTHVSGFSDVVCAQTTSSALSQTGGEQVVRDHRTTAPEVLAPTETRIVLRVGQQFNLDRGSSLILRRGGILEFINMNGLVERSFREATIVEDDSGVIWIISGGQRVRAGIPQR
jgi:hypothetical protein